MRTISLVTAALLLAPGTALAQTGDIEDSDAYARFSEAFAELCLWDEESSAAEYYPSERWELSWENDYSDEPDTATLYKFFCGAGAYNVNHLYYLETDYDGPTPIAFAAPVYDVTYENDDFEAAVEDIKVTGYTTQVLLTNSEFDPETMTITSHALWRGIGDAYSAGTWVFEKGQFVLKRYEVDAQYDGEPWGKALVNFR